MSDEKVTQYSTYARPLLFGFVFLLHVAAFYLFNFTGKENVVETVDFREAEVLKLVDIQEFVSPPPPAVEKKQVVKVTNQPKSSEKILETKEEVQVEKISSTPEQTEYLPQHKISSVPIIPIREVLSKIVYPPMALKQGIEAVVYLELFIDANGNVRKIKVLKDPGHGFAEAAVAALTGITCVPANANGKNCAVRYRYPVKFTLN